MRHMTEKYDIIFKFAEFGVKSTVWAIVMSPDDLILVKKMF